MNLLNRLVKRIVNTLSLKKGNTNSNTKNANKNNIVQEKKEKHTK
jgi:hypothetical protein